jgi:hypothetical protein
MTRASPSSSGQDRSCQQESTGSRSRRTLGSVARLGSEEELVAIGSAPLRTRRETRCFFGIVLLSYYVRM